MLLEYFDLTIITPTSSQTEKVLWVEIEGPTGSFVVGHDHSPLISLLKKQGSLTYHLAPDTDNNDNKSNEDDSARNLYDKDHDKISQKTAQEISIIVSGGIFSVSKNKAIVLLDQ